jgi:Zn-dependent M28 family amino/carboxypeptidase
MLPGSTTCRLPRQDRLHQKQTRFQGKIFLAWLAFILIFAVQAATPSIALSRAPETLTPDPTVQEMIDQVQSGALYDYVAGLSGEKSITIGGAPFTLVNRSTTSAANIEKAAQYAFEHFQSLGLATSYHTWPFSGGERRNVIAEQPGSDPDCLYLLTAHLDDASATPEARAPGADDNASGTAGVLVAADILSQYRFACTLRYVLFSGEEQGLLGSYYYAKMAAQQGDPIQGVLNLDMLGYNTPGSPAVIEMDIRVGQYGDPDRVLSTMMSDVIQAYALGLIPEVIATEQNYSDQRSFWINNFPAILAIEDLTDQTPYYHQPTDTVDTLNLLYFTEYVKAVVGALAHLGQVEPGPPVVWQIYLPQISR